MGSSIDTAGETAHHNEARGRELAAEHPCNVRSVRGACAGAHDRDGRLVEDGIPRGAAHEQPGRRIEDRRQRRREPWIGSPQPADRPGCEPGTKGALVEPATKLLEPPTTGSDRLTVPRDAEEGRLGELAHELSSVGER
jgi:hypothetical protein